MSAINFKTHTLLDIRAITILGLNVKPNSRNPIGYFGTGLKMAIATLVRERIPITLFIGTKVYQFSTRDIDFRAKDFQQVIMRRKDSLLSPWQSIELPFTTELAKNWELWMAFRELESNTRDEGGETIGILFPETNHDDYIPKTYMSTNTTQFFVYGEVFDEVYNQKDTIFLPGGLTQVTDTGAIQVFDKPSSYIYYRSMRVMKLEKPSLLTYNILSRQELTEDRTLKDQWYLPYQIAHWLIACKDTKLVHRLMSASEENYEYELPIDSASAEPSKEFLDVVMERKAAQKPARTPKYIPLAYSPRIATFVQKHQPKVESDELPLSTRFETWWKNARDHLAIKYLEDGLIEEVVTALKGKEEDIF